MGNPQTSMLNQGVKSSNSHLSGRFAGTGAYNMVQNEEHSSTLHSTVNTSMQNNGFFNNNSQNNDSLPSMRNNKFVKQDVTVSNTEIKTERVDTSVPGSQYMNDPRVRANLDVKKDANQLIDTKTMMVLGLIVMIFIFILPIIYDVLN